MPNGCTPCDCCSCVCWWYTTWHKSITKTNLLWAPPGAAVWTLIGNTVTNVGGNPDYMYLGVSDPSTCQITGLFAINDNGDVTADTPPNPLWQGNLTYTNGTSTVVVGVTNSLLLVLNTVCDGDIADAIIWSGSGVVGITPGYVYDIASGTITPPFGVPGLVNLGLLPGDIIGGSGTIVDCQGTIAIDGEGVSLPPLTIAALRDPNCEA